MKKEKEQMKKEKEKVKVNVKGMYNLGNSCYINATLQCLAHTEIIRDIGNNNNNNNMNIKNGSILFEWNELMKEYWNFNDNDNDNNNNNNNNNKSIISPKNIRNSLQEYNKNIIVMDEKEWIPDKQGDVLNCIFQLINNIHEDINEVKEQKVIKRVEIAEKEDEYIAEKTWKLYEKARYCSPFTTNQTLQGLLRTEHFCTKCDQRIQVLFDEFLVLKLPISSSNDNINIETCLIEYQKKRILRNNNKFCTKCNQDLPISEKRMIFYAPEFLILALDRFDIDKNEKNNTYVTPNLEIDLKDYCASKRSHQKKSLQYKLYAMATHLGSTANGGHYIAKVKCEGQWVNCNDSQVDNITESEVIEDKQGYVFFYQNTV